MTSRSAQLPSATPAVAVSPFIHGEVVESKSSASVELINPSSGRRLPPIPAGHQLDVDRAVASARRTFESDDWSEAAPSFRKARLHRLADLIEQQAAVLDALDAEEMGKPVSEAFANAAGAATYVRFFAEATDKLAGQLYPSDRNSLVMQRNVPRGVVAAVVPWNFPIYNAVMKLAPALAAGNTLVLKPSELSSRSAMRLMHMVQQADIPAGVVNLVPGLGETVGRALGLHRDVDMLSFTGSTAIGRLMLQYSGQSNMKVVMAECGGKSPQIVFDDGVDLVAAGEAVARELLINQGQLCSVGSRLLVQRSAEERLLEIISARVRQIVMGDALDPATTFGPLVSQTQLTRVTDFITQAPEEGARLVIGGHRALIETGGYFIEPTVFRGVAPQARIAQEEIFGPVLAVTAFDSEEQALSLANSTSYGLAAYVWTADLSRGMRMAKGIRSPVIINAAAPRGEGAGHAAPWEPARQSGFGVEGGLSGLESYMRRQLVWFNHA